MRFLAILMALLLVPSAAGATVADETAAEALATSQRALDRPIGDWTFRDLENREVTLSSLRGKPLVIAFVYSSCIQSCPVIIETLADAERVARDALGADSFQVAVVGFDAAHDTPTGMARFARQHRLDGRGWHFLSADPETVIGFTERAGFTWFPTAKGFDHLDQVTVVDAEGVIYRQVYGASFDLPALVEPLKELVFGTRAPWSSPAELWKKVKLFCTIYDPGADRYRFDYSIFFQLFVGSTIILLMIGFVVRNGWRLYREAAKRRRKLGGVH